MIFILCLLRHIISACILKFNVSGQIYNPKGIHCFDNNHHQYTLEGYNDLTTDEFSGEVQCTYTGDGCDKHNFLKKYPYCEDNDPFKIDIQKSDIPDFCFTTNPYAIIINEVDVPGFEVKVWDSYNESVITIPNDSESIFMHPKDFYLYIYYNSELCELNKYITSLSARVKGNSETIKYSSFVRYCEPLKIRIVFNFPDNYYLFYEINSDNNIQSLKSNNIYTFGYLFNMSVYVSNEYNGEKIKIDKIFTGSPQIQNYDLTEMDIPEKYRTYKVEITNNINENGYNVYAKIIGNEEYNKIESSQTYSHSDTKKFVVEIYKKSEGCTEYVYCQTISSSLTPNSITLTNDDIINGCDTNIKYYNITIKNAIYPGYKIIAVDSLHHEKIIIQMNETVTIERKQNFYVNISLQMDACFSGYTMPTLTSENNKYKEYTAKDLPNYECRPYYAKFQNIEPNDYKFYYTIDYEDDSVLHNLTDALIYSGYSFSLTLYVTSSNGRCNMQVFKDEFRGNRTYYNIVDYIPKKCQTVLYKVIIEVINRPDDCTLQYTTSLNSTMITADEIINVTAEENFKLNVFLTYKHCSNYYVGSYQADSFPTTKNFYFDNLPAACKNENQKYQVLFNISDLPSEYSIEYQILDYSKNEYGPSTKASELINIEKNAIFGLKVVLASSPGCSNSLLFEIKVDDVLPMQNITINDIPIKCRMTGVESEKIPENEILDVRFEYYSDSTSEEIGEEIKSLFNDELLWESTQTKDKVIEVQGISNYPLKFNMNLEDNEYISMKGEKFISYENGNLNLFMDSDYAYVYVPEKVNLKVKGGGSLTIRSECKDVHVSSPFIINKDLELAMYDGIERLNLDSIDIYENVSITKDSYSYGVRVNIKNVNLKPGANVSIENAFAIENLTINQPGKLFTDGSFEDSNIFFNLKSNIDLFPIIQGSLTKPPKSISITNEAGEPEINQEITLISSQDSSEFYCDQWLNALELDGSGYNDKKCISKFDNSRFLSYSSSIIIKKIDDDNGGNNNKNGLKPGVIAAIVIVVIVVVAAIIVAVVFIIRKKKNTNNSESQDEGNAENI